MRRSGLVAGAMALQAAIMLAAMPSAPQRVDDPAGRGIWDALKCASCVVGGLVMVATGTTVAADDPGSQAVAECVDACIAAVE
jgi:hypothetical protein